MIQYDFYADRKAFVQKIKQIEDLHTIVENCVRLKEEPLLVKKSKLNLSGDLETIKSDGVSSDHSLIREVPEHLEETNVLNTGMNFNLTQRSSPGTAGEGTKRTNTLILKPEIKADGDNKTVEAPNSQDSLHSESLSL